MFLKHLRYLLCPSCGGSIAVKDTQPEGEKIEEGTLICDSCKKIFPVRHGVPRFVEEHYTEAFGLEWLRHSRTQYDSHTGLPISEKRIFQETSWPRNLEGEVILEAASGSGRFTEVLASTGALVVSFDASAAVEANYSAHNALDNVLIVQADLHQMPFQNETFDRVICIGVLQHTPDPKRSLFALTAMLRPGGYLATDIYLRHPWYRQIFNTRFWVRPITKRLPPKLLYKICERYINLVWPLAQYVHELPFGQRINHKMFVPELLDAYNLSPELHKEWTLLHLYDWLSPQYDYPQTLSLYKQWFDEIGFENVVVRYGYGGVEGHGRKPPDVMAH
jgi:SAM-dependent methyltransferase